MSHLYINKIQEYWVTSNAFLYEIKVSIQTKHTFKFTATAD